MPVEPPCWSVLFPSIKFSHFTALNSSNLSWAKVAASVMWPPKELFFVVVTMRPARANKEKERMTMATNTSINVNPLDLNNGFNSKSPFRRIFTLKVAKPIPRGFTGKREERTIGDYSNILKGCNPGMHLVREYGMDFGRACYEKIKPSGQNVMLD